MIRLQPHLRTPAIVRATISGFLLCATASGCDDTHADPPLTSGAHAQEHRDTDAVAELNFAARQSYAAARVRLLGKSGPVLLVAFDQLTLHYQGKKLTTGTDGPTPVTPNLHRIKNVAHGVALGLYPALQDCADIPWATRQPELDRLKSLMQRAADQPVPPDFTTEQIAREDRLLQNGAAFLQTVVTSNACPTANALATFIAAQKPDLAASTKDTTVLYLDHLHSETNALLEQLPADAPPVTVVVTGTQLPRAKNVAIQYFARRFGLPGEGPRLLYAEMIFDKAGPMSLLGTYRLDQLIGKAFFDDEWRMHRDLLADDAAAYLPSLLPTAP